MGGLAQTRKNALFQFNFNFGEFRRLAAYSRDLRQKVTLLGDMRMQATRTSYTTKMLRVASFSSL